jgi:hypothetical protein
MFNSRTLRKALLMFALLLALAKASAAYPPGPTVAAYPPGPTIAAYPPGPTVAAYPPGPSAV